jgi:hypothetical protein
LRGAFDLHTNNSPSRMGVGEEGECSFLQVFRRRSKSPVHRLTAAQARGSYQALDLTSGRVFEESRIMAFSFGFDNSDDSPDANGTLRASVSMHVKASAPSSPPVRPHELQDMVGLRLKPVSFGLLSSHSLEIPSSSVHQCPGNFTSIHPGFAEGYR